MVLNLAQGLRCEESEDLGLEEELGELYLFAEADASISINEVLSIDLCNFAECPSPVPSMQIDDFVMALGQELHAEIVALSDYLLYYEPI